MVISKSILQTFKGSFALAPRANISLPRQTSGSFYNPATQQTYKGRCVYWSRDVNIFVRDTPKTYGQGGKM